MMSRVHHYRANIVSKPFGIQLFHNHSLIIDYSVTEIWSVVRILYLVTYKVIIKISQISNSGEIKNLIVRL